MNKICFKCKISFVVKYPHNLNKFCSHKCRNSMNRCPSTPVETRMWPRVKKTKTCWLWQGATTKRGYGLIGEGDKKLHYVHRLSWIQHFGEIKNNLWVLHKCDNPPCVNPKHLFLGTVVDNNLDMKLKGRMYHPKWSKETREKIKIAKAQLPL